MVNLPSVFVVVVLICFCSVLFCLFVCFYLFFYFFWGGRGGRQDPSSFYTQPPSGFLSFVEEISLSIAYIWGYGGGGFVTLLPPNQELHLVLKLPYKYRLFNYFNFSKKLQRFMQDTYETTSFLSFSFLLNIRCCTQSICLKSI